MIKGSLLCTLIMIWGALFYQIFQDNTILMRAQLIFNIVILDIVIILPSISIPTNIIYQVVFKIDFLEANSCLFLQNGIYYLVSHI